MSADYVSELGAKLVVEETGTRFRRGDDNVIFVGRTPSDVVRAVNDALHVIIEYYSANLERAKVRVSKLHVREASLKVALYVLYGCNVRNEPLVVSNMELDGMFCRGNLLWFCQKNFGKRQRAVAAAMMGLGESEFERWEAGWERYCNR